ncbi:MAG: DAK2 domain-containing protein [Thermoleophilaceae bacterium]|nr:DAK2 domain-containing protein [Thermoleophilaceae bacterium]
MPDESLLRFRRVVAASLSELESRRGEVNDLNVFPVADGDTGDNMAMTMRAVLEELDGLDGRLIDEIGRDELVAAVARAALLGARGNSGVILSQIVRGAAEELASRPGELVDPVLVAAAFARASDAAYDSVRDPAEGTMLSAVRAMAHRVARDLAHLDTPRLGPESSPAEQDELIAEVLERALDSANEAVERGPEQLPVLKEAGVVDAGAYGLTVIVAGVVAALRGEQVTELPHREAPAAHSENRPEHRSSTFRYCTNFAVTGEGLEAAAFTPLLEAMGDSVLVVGDEQTLRVHLHTDDPESAVALFADAGEASRLDVADMHQQVADRTARLASADPVFCSLVAVASGPGIVRLYEELGVSVLDGGRTMNPSTYELLAAIHAAEGEQVVVLPNSPNVLMAAERAAELSDRPAHVVPTRAQQEGLAALLAFDPTASAEHNAAAVREAAAGLRLGGVAPSARTDPQGRFEVGDALGYRADELVAWGDPAATLRATLAEVAAGAEILTCLVGAGAPLGREAIEAAVPEGVELDLHEGGQPAWWWLLCAE